MGRLQPVHQVHDHPAAVTQEEKGEERDEGGQEDDRPGVPEEVLGASDAGLDEPLEPALRAGGEDSVDGGVRGRDLARGVVDGPLESRRERGEVRRQGDHLAAHAWGDERAASDEEETEAHEEPGRGDATPDAEPLDPRDRGVEEVGEDRGHEKREHETAEQVGDPHPRRDAGQPDDRRARLAGGPGAPEGEPPCGTVATPHGAPGGAGCAEPPGAGVEGSLPAAASGLAALT